MQERRVRAEQMGMEMDVACSSLESRLGMSLDEIAAAEKSSTAAARHICRSLKAELEDAELAMKLDKSLEDLIRDDRKANGGGRSMRRRGATSLRRQFFAPPLFGQNRCSRCCQPRHPAGARCLQESWTCYNCGAVGHRAFECPSESLVFAFRDESEPELDEPDDEDEQQTAAAAVRTDVTLADLLCQRPGGSDQRLEDLMSPRSVTVASHAASAVHVTGTWRLGDVLPQEEDRKHEFKRSLRTDEEYEKYLCAFANAKGGKLYIGVEDDGTCVGVEIDRKHRDLYRLRMDQLIHGMRPAGVLARCVKVSFEPVRGASTGTHVILISVTRSVEVCATRDSCVFLRRNGSVSRLGLEESMALQEEKVLEKHKLLRQTTKAQRWARRRAGIASSSDESDSDGSSSMSPSPKRGLATSASELEDSSSASDSEGGEGGEGGESGEGGPSALGGAAGSGRGRQQRRRLNQGGHALDSVPEDDGGVEAAVQAIVL